MGGLLGRIQIGGSIGVFARTGEPPPSAFGSFPPRGKREPQGVDAV
jgi:hypothetical protein